MSVLRFATEQERDAVQEPFHAIDDIGTELPYVALTGDDMPHEAQYAIRVSATQFIRALMQLDMYTAIDAAIASSGNAEAQVLWARAPTFASDDPLVVSMAQAINLTDVQVLAVFQLAQSL